MKGLVTIALKNLRHRIPIALSIALVISLLFSGVSWLRVLIQAQEKEADKMSANTRIACLVTNAAGSRTEGIGVISAFAQMLQGKRHERGCYLDTYVRDLQVSARERLQEPANAVMIRANALAAAGDMLTVEFYEGWDDAALAGSERVCAISESLLNYVAEDGTIEIHREVFDPVTLQVIGILCGQEDCLLCPFDAPLVDGESEAFLLDRCSFTLADNQKLTDAKQDFYIWFVIPALSNSDSPGTAGLLIQDAEYDTAMAEIQAHLTMLQRIRVTLLVLSACLGILMGFLISRRRLREYAVMRCLGMKQSRVLLAVMLEQLLPAIPGLIIGVFINLALLPDGSALMNGFLQLLFYLGGSLLCAAMLTHIAPIRLMKTEE